MPHREACNRLEPNRQRIARPLIREFPLQLLSGCLYFCEVALCLFTGPVFLFDLLSDLPFNGREVFPQPLKITHETPGQAPLEVVKNGCSL